MIDCVLYNGNIHTLNGVKPHAEALAVSMGRIVAVGSNDEIRSLIKRGTIKHNLNGKTVIPGLTDAHLHYEWQARALQDVDVFEVPAKADAISRVQARVATTQPGEWITGRGWTQHLWEGGAFPTAADLDAVAPENPVMLRAKSGHAAWVNTKALQAARISIDTVAPEGGEIIRDASGEATGILLEGPAMNLVARLIPRPDSETLAGYVKETQAQMLASGITCVHDFDNPSLMYAVQLLRERGEQSIRVVKQINKDWLDHTLALGIRSGFGDDWIRYGGLKLFADGALGPRTAYMVEPYEGEPDNYGMTVVPKDEMRELILRATVGGLASTVHAIGDRAVRDVLDIFEQARKDEEGRSIHRDQRRHRIEHVQIIHPDDKHRLAELDVIASMQPIHATSDWQAAIRHWGEERSEFAYNARLQIDLGAKVAFGSDAPVEPFEPLLGIYAAITRKRPDGNPPGGWFPELCLTMDETLRGFTTGAAYAAGTEDHQGQLSVGYLADLVVLDRDPYETPHDEFLDTQIVATMVDGVWRYGGIE